MAIIDIPRNAKTIEYNGVIYDVPHNAAQIEIPDTAPQQTFSAPSAPKVAQDTGKQKDTSPIGLGDFIDAINPFAGAQKGITAKDKIYNAVKKEIGGLFDYQANSGATGEELERQNLTKQLSKAQHVADDTTLINKIFGDESRTKRINDSADALMRSWALKNGYDDYGEMNGKKVVKKGDKFIPIDEPGIMESFSTSLNEMGVPAGAVMLLSNLPQFRGLNLAGKAVTTLGATGVASGFGRVMDVKRAADNLGADLSAGDYLQRGVNASNDDLTLGLALTNGAKLAKPTLGVAKWTADKALKLAGHTPVIHQVTTGNISGAKRYFDKTFANADFDEIAGLYEKMPQFTTTTLEATKNDIGGISKAIVNKMPKLSEKNKSKIIESTTDLSSKIIDLFNSGEVGAARELFLKVASSTPEGGAIISNILKRNGNLKSVASDIVEKPVMQARTYLKEAGADENALRETMQNYESSTKQDFKDMIEAIDGSYAGVKTSIDPAKLERLADDMYSSFTGDASESFIKRTIDRLLSGEKSIKELNEARNAINENFSSYFQNPNKSYNTLKFANSLKSVIDEGIDDILKQKPQIYEKSRTLYDTALDDYSKMAEARGLDFNKMALNDEALSSKTGEKALKALNNQGGTFKKYVANLSEADAQRVELGAINSLFEKSIGKADNQTEFIKSNLLDSLKGYEFRTKVANETKEFLLNLSKIARGHENISSGLTGVRIKGQGTNLATSWQGKLRQTMIARSWEKLVSLIPYWGDEPAFMKHLTKSLQGAKTIDEFKINILKEITAPTTDSATRQLLIRYFNETFGDEKKVKQDAVSEVVDEFKQNLKAQHDANIAELKGEKLQNKEKRGIYNVTYNSKNSTKIKKYDLDILKDFIKYERGNESKGAIHIRKHLKNGSVGEVSTEEILEMGEVVRKGKKHIEDGRKVFTLYKDDGTRLRVVVGDKGKTQKVITFYSDRNIKR